MSFSQNLQNLRKRENMSQETLAGLLDVSRQAVSKWESGNAYPETEKIISMCKIFNCSMDSLVMGEISATNVENNYDNELKQEYDSFYNKYSKAIAFGVGLILFGVTFLVGLTSKIDSVIMDHAAVAVLMFCVLIAVPIFIVFGLKDGEIKKKIKDIGQIYSDEETKSFKRKYPFAIAGGVGFILFGVMSMFVLHAIAGEREYPVDPVAFLLLCITIAVPFIIYFSLQNEKYDVKRLENKEETEQEKKVTKISGVIMLVATFIFLFLGFVFHLWHIAWVVFPLGGIICAIISTIIGDVK